MVNTSKNRNREAPSFANINMLGKCNVDCFFCLGKDIERILTNHNQLATPFNRWKNFVQFLDECKAEGIKKIYLTGQNTDPLMYTYLRPLIEYIQNGGFNCGIRTNGYLALKHMHDIGLLKDEVGYSIHTVSPMTSRMILGRSDIPDWDSIIPTTQKFGMPVRVSVVLNRCNYHEFFTLMRYLKKFELPYVQIRQVSTDTRQDELSPDIRAYEETYTAVSRVFPMKARLWEDAEVYDIFGVPVVFWRTVRTSVNSWNYFEE